MILGVWDAANLVTLAGLGLSLAAVALAAQGHPGPALGCLLWAGVCDLYDGVVARRLARTDLGRAFGAQLDTVVDMASFGVVPALLLRTLALRDAVDLPLLLVFVGAAAVRLAWFNATAGAPTRGLPVTYVAWIVPLALLLVLVLPPRPFVFALRGVVLLVTVLFVLGFRTPRLGLGARHALTAVAAGLTAAWWWCGGRLAP
jgi:CDP-diacylglycerol--serine O-phosphatidyltransferase